MSSIFKSYVSIILIIVAVLVFVGIITVTLDVQKARDFHGAVVNEIEKSGCRFGREKLYVVMVKYITPILLLVLLLLILALSVGIVVIATLLVLANILTLLSNIHLLLLEALALVLATRNHVRHVHSAKNLRATKVLNLCAEY